MYGRDLLSISDLSADELSRLLSTALSLKRDGWPRVLEGQTLALLFEKPSLRTRVSFDVAMQQLGGHTVYLSQSEVGLGQREPVSDVARVLSRYVHGIVARTYAQQTLVDLAEFASVPVINALSDEEHPCQALADLLTIVERKGALKGVRIAFIGDGNNVATSLAEGAVLQGADVTIAAPPGYRLNEDATLRVEELSRVGEGRYRAIESPEEAVREADVIYTDVWTSMGQEHSYAQRARAFAQYKVTPELMSLAKPDAIFMHDLPAHRGEEVAESVIEGGQSVVFDQAENRLHAQRAVLVEFLHGGA